MDGHPSGLVCGSARRNYLYHLITRRAEAANGNERACDGAERASERATREASISPLPAISVLGSSARSIGDRCDDIAIAVMYIPTIIGDDRDAITRTTIRGLTRCRIEEKVRHLLFSSPSLPLHFILCSFLSLSLSHV